MDTDAKDAYTTNGCKTEATLDGGDSQKIEENVNGDEDSVSNSLLPPRRGGMSRKSNKTRRKVQWNDRNGNNLVEVLEFEPSYFGEEVEWAKHRMPMPSLHGLYPDDMGQL